jgi:hypothetical protein
MTGAFQMLMGSAGLNITPFSLVLKDSQTGTATTAMATLKADGSITVQGNASSATPATWAAPLTSTNGTRYWVMATVLSGTTPTSGTVGSRVALSGAPFWSWGRNTVGTTSSQVRLDFFTNASSGGAVYSSTFNVTCTMN